MKKYCILSVVFVGILLFVNIVPAQETGLGAIGPALEKLKEDILFVRDLLSAFPDRQASTFLDNAIRLSKEAETLANRDSKAAWLKIKLARDTLARAFAILSRRDFVRRTREKVWEVLRRAEIIVPGSGNKEAERLLRSAQSTAQKAERRIQIGNFREGLELSRVVIFQAERAMTMVQGAKLPLKDSIEQEKQRFLELLNRAETAVDRSGNSAARQVLQQARQQLPVIQNALNKGQNNLALSLYHNTTRLLLRAIDLANGSKDYDRPRLEDEFTMLEELINSAREKITAANNPTAKRIFEKAEENYNIAMSAWENGHNLRALRRVAMARRMIGRASNLVSDEKPLLDDRARDELDRLLVDLEALDNDVETVNSATAKQLVDAAYEMAGDAENFIDDNQLQLALESIFAANKLMAAVRRQIKLQQSNTTQDAKIEIERLERSLQEANERGESQGENEKLLLRQAENLYQRAKKALEDGKPVLATEYTKIAFDLILKSMRGFDNIE